MCGILAIFNHLSYNGEGSFKSFADHVSRKQAHRGPEWRSVVQLDEYSALAHERLCIVGSVEGAQPIRSNESSALAIVNGEIYNYKEIIRNFQKEHELTTKSDCEVILHLYEDEDTEFLSKLRGMYAFVVYDKGRYIIGRDQFGLSPLYMGRHRDGSVWVASELKCLAPYCEIISRFPPGHLYDSKTRDYKKYYLPEWSAPMSQVSLITPCNAEIRTLLSNAIKEEWENNSSFGVFLSGGFKSSLLVHMIRSQFPDQNIKTFSIGLEGVPALEKASLVAQRFKTDHREIIVTTEDALETIEELVYHLESFNIELVRSAIPIYMLSKWAKVHGMKVILVGDGLDEISFGIQNGNTVDCEEEIHNQCVKQIENFYRGEGLRSNKTPMAYGIEARMPYLSLDFANYMMHIHPSYKKWKNGIGKEFLRECFDEDLTELPSILNSPRKSIIQSFGGETLINQLQEKIEKTITDERFNNASKIFPLNPPKTKEEFFYRQIFESHFKNQSATLVSSEQIYK